MNSEWHNGSQIARPLPKPYRITFCLNLYEHPEDRHIANKAVRLLLFALTLTNIEYLRAHPETPLLYQSGVVYQEEPPGQEDWQDIPTTLALGYGDCEDLACWRAAELQVRSGIAAWPSFIWRRNPRSGGLLYHIQVSHPHAQVRVDGTRNWLTEDPSRRLGMR